VLTSASISRSIVVLFKAYTVYNGPQSYGVDGLCKGKKTEEDIKPEHGPRGIADL